MRHAREGSGGTFFDFNETFLVNLFVINYFKFAILASSARGFGVLGFWGFGVGD